MIDASPLLKRQLLDAVAVAAGRLSPDEILVAAGQLILLAEDNPINRDVLTRQINALGYAVEVVDDGAQALDAWRTDTHAILLTDCQMPVMDGYELVIEAKLANATMRVGNRDVQLTAGMGVSVEVQTAERSVASFVFDTVLRASKEALR